MKLKEGWTLTELSGEYVAVPTGASAKDFCGIVRLNETGKDIWECLEKGMNDTEICEKLIEIYDCLDFERAKNAVNSVIDTLRQEGLLVE